MPTFAEQQTLLHEKLLSKATFEEGRSLCQVQNAQLHQSAGPGALSLLDQLLEDLGDHAFSYQPPGDFETIAWALWHITRIEDAIGNLLIAGTDQVFDAEWNRRIGSQVTDTGNAMTAAEALAFSQRIVPRELAAYRRAVGRRSQEVIAAVTQDQIRKKPSAAGVERIVAEGVLVEDPQSFWLRDFWANKTIGGLLLLPLTRHQMMHLPNCFRLKDLAQNVNGKESQ